MNLGSIAFRNIRRNTKRSILSATAIAVATFTIVFMFALIHGMTKDMEWNITSYVTGEIRLRNREYDKNEMMNPVHLNIQNASKIITGVEELPGTLLTVPRIPFLARVYRNHESFNIRGVGLDFEKEKQFQDLGKHIIEGSLPEPGTSGAILGLKLAKNMDLKIGDKFTVLTTTVYRSTNAMTFTVAGIAAFSVAGLNSSTFYAPLARIQRLIKARNSVTEILVKVKKSSSLKKTVKEISHLLVKDGDTTTGVKAYTSMDTTLSLMAIAQLSYDLIALIFFILASSVIVNTTIMVIYERMKEIGTMSAMGMTGGQIQRLFFLEAFFVGILGALAGVIIGIGITLPLSSIGINFGSAMEGINMEISNTIKPALDLFSTVFVFAFSVAVSSLSTLLPTRKAACIEPAEALKSI